MTSYNGGERREILLIVNSKWPIRKEGLKTTQKKVGKLRKFRFVI